MFAGGRVTTHKLLRYGSSATRKTRITATTSKQGRNGPLTFVTVRNEYTQNGELAIVDENDIVYRAPSTGIATRPGTLDAQPLPFARMPAMTLRVDEALLFRFSALTYNAHRIHYDHNWVREEGYPDLVVHGPLQALMMAELIRRRGAGLIGRQFSYRLISPMIGPQVFTVLAGADGVDSGAEVRDVFGTVTAVSTTGPAPA
jgi:3-methylfumaryl-CoA hydratase